MLDHSERFEGADEPEDRGGGEVGSTCQFAHPERLVSLYETLSERTRMTDLVAINLAKTADALDAPDQSTYSAGQWATLVELAALYRAVHLYGMSDLVNGAGRICSRSPGWPRRAESRRWRVPL